MDLQTIAAMCGGVLVQGDPAAVATSVSTDTRTIVPGAFFVALVGDRFDAHDFLPGAVHDGAVGLLVSRARASSAPEGCGVVEVEDTLDGLQKMAAAYRAALGVKGVAITGSSGKTSTKDMVGAVVRKGFRTRSTAGNLNNHIGVPLTLLAMEEGDEVGVWEMGMNHPGEIAALAAIARPDIAVVTNVGTAHIEFMVTQEAIAEEKGALAAAVGAGGGVVLNANDPFSPAIAQRCSAPVTMAGVGCGDVRADDLVPTASGTAFGLTAGGRTAAAEIPVPGRHMVQNAAIAAAAGLALGISLEDAAEALGTFELTGGRLEAKSVRGVRFLDDTYNANPDSVRAALATLSAIPVEGRRVAVLGRMAELGGTADDEHFSIGKAAADEGVDVVVSVGGGAGGIAEGARSAGAAEVAHFGDKAAAVEFLRRTVGGSDVVLVKGSRSAAMEEVIGGFAAS